MSRFSGVCDLYDCMMLEGKDEMESFDEFKRKTGGVIHQWRPVTLVSVDDAFALAKNKRNYLTVITTTSKKKDKRYKSDVSETTSYSFLYQSKKFSSLTQLNNYGVLALFDIHFSNILELIPYYPYAIRFECCSADTQYIDIPYKSEIDKMAERDVCAGRDKSYADRLRHDLQWHYVDIVNKFYNPKERTAFGVKSRVVKFNDRLVVFSPLPVDKDWPITVEKTLHSWIYSSPKVSEDDPKTIDVTDVWPDELKDGDSITLTYVYALKALQYQLPPNATLDNTTTADAVCIASMK